MPSTVSAPGAALLNHGLVWVMLLSTKLDAARTVTREYTLQRIRETNAYH
jgi:hypothetical protein